MVILLALVGLIPAYPHNQTEFLNELIILFPIKVKKEGAKVLICNRSGAETVPIWPKSVKQEANLSRSLLSNCRYFFPC